MKAFLVLLTGIALICLWVFLTSAPKYGNKKAVAGFNYSVLGVLAMLVLSFVARIYSSMSGTINDKWWAIFAFGGSLLITVLVLLLGWAVRNFWIFRPPRSWWER